MTHSKCWILLTIVVLSLGCKDLTQPLPAGTQDPENYKTRGGALVLHRGVLRAAQIGFVRYVSESGQLTDELSHVPFYNGGRLVASADVRRFTEGDDATQRIAQLYMGIHSMRNNAMQGIAALRTYLPDSSALLRAELYALQGYSEIMLAEGFCSGIPLSTVDFEKDFTYQSGMSTQEVLHHAIAVFDTALALSGDSVRIKYLARIGKARVLLFLDSVRTAAEMVSGVPENYRYTLPIDLLRAERFFPQDFKNMIGTIANREGQNGLPFITSKDPRSATDAVKDVIGTGDTMYLPRKYNVPAEQMTFVVANGIEARLIEAEADLRTTQGRWLAILNDLRTDGTYVVSPGGSGPDTIWNAGTGGISGLPPLRDPGTGPLPAGKSAADVRIDLLFTERAYWLFLTGHRQGDLRRLVRAPYSRESDTVYPTGPYGPNGIILGFFYGDAITFPVPESEQRLNPLYHGCLSGDA